MAMFEVNLRPDKRTLRVFGYIALVGFGVLGGIVYKWKGLFGLDFGGAAEPISYILWAVGLASAALSLTAPAANRPLYLAMILITYPIGFVVSHVLLAIVFFGVIMPIGLFFRLVRRDPLRRRFDHQAASYWVPHRPPDNIERYFRQF